MCLFLQYRESDIERVRAAIKQRTQALGIEESKVTADYIQAAQERAKLAIENGGMPDMLDLSQISSTAPRGKKDDVPDMFYEPEDEMTEAEMIEADPDGQLPLLEQAMKEIGLADWPTPLEAFKEVFLVLGLMFFSCVLITQWDGFLRDVYTGLGFIPRPEDIMQGTENIALPEGWTNGMSEDDFMNFQDEVGKAAVAASSFFLPDP